MNVDVTAPVITRDEILIEASLDVVWKIQAIAALGIGGFCVGSCAFHVLTGRRKFANGTLPWSTPPNGSALQGLSRGSDRRRDTTIG
jgi:hypothetical protein